MFMDPVYIQVNHNVSSLYFHNSQNLKVLHSVHPYLYASWENAFEVPWPFDELETKPKHITFCHCSFGDTVLSNQTDPCGTYYNQSTINLLSYPIPCEYPWHHIRSIQSCEIISLNMYPSTCNLFPFLFCYTSKHKHREARLLYFVFLLYAR